MTAVPLPGYRQSAVGISERLRYGTCGALVLAAAGVAAAGQPAGGGQVQVHLDRGRVTLAAVEARPAEILAAWSRAGGTRFVGTEALGDETLTLRLVAVDEAEALRILLGSAAGYVAAARRAPVAGASRYDRVKVLALSGQGPRLRAGPARPAPPTFNPAAPGGALPAADVRRLLAAVTGRQTVAAPAETVGETPAVDTEAPARTVRFPGMTVEPGR